MSSTPHVPYAPPDVDDPVAAAAAFAARVASRRSVREFSDRPVPRAVIEAVVRAAGSAPSGAHKQPWRFVCVSEPALKRRIREGAEAEEHEFYTQRAPESWLRDLEPFGVNERKPFLEIAPWLIVVFRRTRDDEGGQVYYAQESVGLACGMLLCAIHHAGLAALTHTPSPMAFLGEILGRPKTEKPFLLIPVGYPAAGCRVPDLQRKALDDIAVFR